MKSTHRIARAFWIIMATATIGWSQTVAEGEVWKGRLDSLLTKHAFNGVIVVAKGEHIVFERAQGYANIAMSVPIQMQSRFGIGSISKQITAVLVLQLHDRGLLDLMAPVKKYLPELPAPWAEVVTVHQLLTHTHGIQELDQDLAFPPGSQFEYSQIGFELLSGITERVGTGSFISQAQKLFSTNALHHTSHPRHDSTLNMVRSYTWKKGVLCLENFGTNLFIAAGGFVSNAEDMVRWNNLLHTGKLVSEESLQLMREPYATRQHPIMGAVRYGYGLTFLPDDSERQIGAFGYVPGFVSANYFYPQSGLSLVILENIARSDEDIKKTFIVETEAMKILRAL